MNHPKSILITGCSSGIGLCSAVYLQKRGFQVFPTARKTQDIKHLKQLGFEPINLDLTDSQSIRQAVEIILDKTQGTLYGLINNAGFVQPGDAANISRKVLQSQFETNVFGLHELTQTILPTMINQQKGRIIHVSSVLGFVARAHLAAYNASKYAVEGLADTMRLELHQYPNIHVVLVEPGPIQSHIQQNALSALEKRQEEKPNQADNTLLTHLKNDQHKNAFTLPPEAVAKAFYHALTAKRPKIRYRITTPCRTAAIAKRLLSDRMLDRLLIASDPDNAKT